jgi:enoyl reductase-like protein
VTVEGMSYSMTVSVNGRPPLTLAGTTLAELDRDLKAAAAELGK